MRWKSSETAIPDKKAETISSSSKTAVTMMQAGAKEPQRGHIQGEPIAVDQKPFTLPDKVHSVDSKNPPQKKTGDGPGTLRDRIRREEQLRLEKEKVAKQQMAIKLAAEKLRKQNFSLSTPTSGNDQTLKQSPVFTSALQSKLACNSDVRVPLERLKGLLAPSPQSGVVTNVATATATCTLFSEGPVATKSVSGFQTPNSRPSAPGPANVSRNTRTPEVLSPSTQSGSVTNGTGSIDSFQAFADGSYVPGAIDSVQVQGFSKLTVFPKSQRRKGVARPFVSSQALLQLDLQNQIQDSLRAALYTKHFRKAGNHSDQPRHEVFSEKITHFF